MAFFSEKKGRRAEKIRNEEVHEIDGKYYEIFSNKRIKEEVDTHNDGVTYQTFDTPYIEKVEPLREY